MSNEVVVLVTIGSRDEAERLSEALVEERLAACVHVVGPVRSIYRWEGKVRRDDEHLIIIKSTRERYPALEERILSLHPYDVPEVIALPIERGSQAYLRWLREQVEGH